MCKSHSFFAILICISFQNIFRAFMVTFPLLETFSMLMCLFCICVVILQVFVFYGRSFLCLYCSALLTELVELCLNVLFKVIKNLLIISLLIILCHFEFFCVFVCFCINKSKTLQIHWKKGANHYFRHSFSTPLSTTKNKQTEICTFILKHCHCGFRGCSQLAHAKEFNEPQMQEPFSLWAIN